MSRLGQTCMGFKLFMFTRDQLDRGAEVFVEILADHGPKDRQRDVPAAVSGMAGFHDPLPDRFRGAALEQILGLVVFQAPGALAPGLRGYVLVLGCQASIGRQSIPATRIEG